MQIPLSPVSPQGLVNYVGELLHITSATQQSLTASNAHQSPTQPVFQQLFRLFEFYLRTQTTLQ